MAELDALMSEATTALGALGAAELVAEDATEAVEMTRRVEALSRRVRALQIAALAAVEASDAHAADGHASGQVLVAHAAHLSAAEVKRRGRARRMLAQMPTLRAGLEAGRIGACQIDRAALVFVNPRVQAAFVELDAQVALLAAALPYEDFARRLANWVRQVDEDGTADRARQAHEQRRARLVQDFDGGWELLCRIGGVTGAQMHSIFRAFVEAEFQADWAEAREVHGDATTIDHLARTFDQRDADAIARIFECAADAYAAAPGGAPIDTTIVMDHETFEREARRAAGAPVRPRLVPDLGPLPQDPDVVASDEQPAAESAAEPGAPSAHPGRAFRCETSDGHPVDPTEAFANALAGRLRRTVVGWDSVVTDTSGLHRLFTGPLREAIMLGHHRCYWPGCRVPVRHCQGDHLDPRRSGGRTNPGNGAPACGRHNRLKEHGFTVRRDARGRLHVHRPDGSEIE